MSDKDKVNGLVNAHWSYIRDLLDISMGNYSYDKKTVMNMIEFHYKTAMEHGYKHAKEES